MKKIVQVVHDFLPGYPHGTENYTYHLSKELQKISKVHIFCREGNDSFGKDFSKDELFDGLPVRRLYFNPPLTFEATYRNYFVEKEFEHFLDIINPDIVHFQHLVRLSASMIEIAKRRRIATILTLHDFWFLCSQIQLLTNGNQTCHGPESKSKCANCEKIFYTYGRLQSSESYYDRKVKFLKYPPAPLEMVKKLLPWKIKMVLKAKFLKPNADISFVPVDVRANIIEERSSFLRNMLDKVDVILAPSRFLIEKFAHYGMARNRIFHLGYGIEDRPFVSFNREPSNKFRFGFVGNVSEHKGIRVLIRAFNKIKRDDVVLSIFGPYGEAYLSKLRKELNIGSEITFYGPFDNRKISSVFSKIDVLVYPSIWYENQPIAILEALLAKIPIITSDMGGMAELVQDGVTGLLFEPGNPEDLSQKMVSLIDNPQLLRKLSEAPRQVKTIEKNAEELNEIYNSLLKRGQSHFC